MQDFFLIVSECSVHALFTLILCIIVYANMYVQGSHLALSIYNFFSIPDTQFFKSIDIVVERL